MTASTIPDVSRHVPALDGMRAGAVLLVILSHYGLGNFIPGGFGVTVFFWISGFLSWQTSWNGHSASISDASISAVCCA